MFGFLVSAWNAVKATAISVWNTVSKPVPSKSTNSSQQSLFAIAGTTPSSLIAVPPASARQVSNSIMSTFSNAPCGNVTQSCPISSPQTNALANKPLGPLSASQMQSYYDAIGASEDTDGKGTVENTEGYLGKYQLGAAALVDAGLIDRDKYNNMKSEGDTNKEIVDDASVWNEPNSKSDLLGDLSLQETIMRQYTAENYKSLENLGVIDADTPAQQVAGYLAVAHLGGPGAASAYQKGQILHDDYGTGTNTYFDLGYNSVAKSPGN